MVIIIVWQTTTRMNLSCRLLFISILLLVLLLHTTSSAVIISTVDKLRSQPLVSDEWVRMQNEACDTSRLCTYDEMNVAAICGSDGRTYNSECEIKRAACHGNPVVKQIDGACPENSKCRLERKFQQDIARRKNSSQIFIPECDDSDGSYSTVQCHQTTGYCWCVTKSGRPEPGSSVRNKRPNCLQQLTNGKNQLRRSSRRRLGRERGGCGTFDRSTFNNNLLKIFQSEYERDPRNKIRTNAKEIMISLEKRVIMWKFNELDTNHNGRLSRKELNGQKKLIKKLIRPHACARQFNKYCDLDKNNDIDSREWMTCLGVDIQTSFWMFSSLNQNGTGSNSYRHHKIKTSAKIRTTIHTGDAHSLAQLAASSSSSGGGFLLKEGSNDLPSITTNDEEKIDCRTMRDKTLTKHMKDIDAGIYVPTCTGTNDILFDQIQCHRLTQYCYFSWCVKPDTGEPIPGTSSRNARPTCTSTHHPIRLNHEIKGCKPRKRLRFFARLISTIEAEMNIMSATTDQQMDTDEIDQTISSKEKAVRWKFAQLDTNKNNKLERKEWKNYRNEMKQWNKVRRCGRNFMRFCDADRDRKITLNEWIRCTIEGETPFMIGTYTANEKNTRSKNPFLTILTPD